MITDSQTNTVFISEKTYNDHPRVTQRVIDELRKRNIPIELLKHTKYSWCRDYMPIQVSENKFVKYRYFPNYMDNDKYRKYITDPEETLNSLGIETVKTDIVIDGGNVIKCPDCVIMTDKVLKENEKHYSKNELLSELERLFECQIVLLPWDEWETYGHADGIVRYAGNNTVLMTNYADFDKGFADKFYDILSKKFDVRVLKYDVECPHKANWAYINFLQTSTAIFVPTFGKEEDEQALRQIAEAFPAYKDAVIPVKLNSIVAKGGALNCITWNILR